MAFKENLLQKIRIDQLAAQVLASIRPEGAESKLDKAAVRQLLSLSPFVHHRERDLDLYVLDTGAPRGRSSYWTMSCRFIAPPWRMSSCAKPEVAEMVKPRNIIKILRDSDVKVSRKAESLKTVQAECIARLDLSFTPEDINDLRRDGIASLQSNYAEGVTETLALFAELLGYRPPPQPFQVPHCTSTPRSTVRKAAKNRSGRPSFSTRMPNELQLTEEGFGSLEKEKIERFHALAAGKEKTAVRGAAVFEYLQQAVLSSRSQGN